MTGTMEAPLFAPARGARARTRAAGKALLFLALALVIAGGVGFAVAQALHLTPASMRAALQRGDPAVLMFNEATVAAGMLGSTVALALAFRERVSTFGFGVTHSLGRRLGDLAFGLLCGFVLLTGLLAAIAAAGGLSFGAPVESAGPALRFAGIYAVLFALVAIAEEFSLRGYLLVQLSRAAGFWPAAIGLSVLFGAVHAFNPGETPAGLLSAATIGLVFAYSFARAGSLMWALGFHAAWDWAQSFVWGVPDSGMTTTGTLFRVATHGPAWLTGGPAGPEGSWLVALPIVLAVVVVRFALPRRARR